MLKKYLMVKIKAEVLNKWNQTIRPRNIAITAEKISKERICGM